MALKRILQFIFITIISLALLITTFGFIYLVFDLVFNLSETNFSGIVAFLGSIIVGALTFIGVIITIKKNREINHDNLEHQKSLQLESINKAAELNDKKERQLIVANIKFGKLDLIVQYMIESNSLNNERFNVIRDYIDCRISLREARKIAVSDEQPTITSRIKNLTDELYLLLDEETRLRIKITSLSAKIKSDSLYINGLDDKLDSFRVFQTYILEEFSELIRQKEYDFGDLLEEKSEKLMERVNASIRLCTEIIKEEMVKLENQSTH